MYPRGREIVLGVAGGISAYKSCELLRRLQDLGLLVTVLPTRSSLNFVGVATWEALSGREVPVDLWNNVHQVPHISIAKRADAIIIAPATADLMAKVATGLADDLLTNVLLASDLPTVFVPAMHSEMWLNPATQHNVNILKSRGYIVVEPASGKLTSGDVGIGRYPEIEEILKALRLALELNSDLLGRRVLISAGGTREAIDPVRYIGNHSSGKQGYALAYAAAVRGAEVTLVAANSNLPDIEGVKTIHVSSAQEMLNALQENFASSEILIMSAAVADVRPTHHSEKKISKKDLTQISLVQNPDITKELSSMKAGQIFIGFAAETEATMEEALDKARRKMQEKELDIIFCNDVSNGAIFGAESTSGIIVDRNGSSEKVSRVLKLTLADKLLDLALDKLG
jgi:phosphopantothenoylcysteine decarboxylase/phosphopantothenate--cysteine ligase